MASVVETHWGECVPIPGRSECKVRRTSGDIWTINIHLYLCLYFKLARLIRVVVVGGGGGGQGKLGGIAHGP